MDDGVAVEIVEVGEDPGFEFGFGSDTDVAEHGSRHVGEETLDEIEPRPVLRREHEGEAAVWLAGQPRLRLLGYVGRMVVQDQLDRGICRISSVEPLEPMAILDAGMSAPAKRCARGCWRMMGWPCRSSSPARRARPSWR